MCKLFLFDRFFCSYINCICFVLLQVCLKLILYLPVYTLPTENVIYSGNRHLGAILIVLKKGIYYFF